MQRMWRAGTVTAIGAVLAALLPASASGAPPPPAHVTSTLPPVVSATDLGVIRQDADISGRDGGFSALVDGRSVWTFGDTTLGTPNEAGDTWVDNSLSWTTDLDASDGITLGGDHADSAGVPIEFLPYTQAELRYNAAHDIDTCSAEPCGAEFALWPGAIVADPARDRVLVFYSELWRVAGRAGWRTVGSGIAVGALDGSGITRPIVDPDSRTATLMWSGDEIGFTWGSTVVDDTLFSYGCTPAFLTQRCRVARVPLADALEKDAWRFYAGGDRWSPVQADAVPVFDAGAAGDVTYVPYLDAYLATYSAVFSNDVAYRVAPTPWGPWSDSAVLFTGRPAWHDGFDNTAHAHAELAQEGGRVQYVTYSHPSGFFRADFPLVRVVLGDPAPR